MLEVVEMEVKGTHIVGTLKDTRAGYERFIGFEVPLADLPSNYTDDDVIAKVA